MINSVFFHWTGQLWSTQEEFLPAGHFYQAEKAAITVDPSIRTWLSTCSTQRAVGNSMALLLMIRNYTAIIHRFLFQLNPTFWTDPDSSVAFKLVYLHYSIYASRFWLRFYNLHSQRAMMNISSFHTEQSVILHKCAADFSLLNLPKGKSLGHSKPATDS